MNATTAKRLCVCITLAGLFLAAVAGARAVETTPVGPDALAKQMEAMTKDVTQGALRVTKKDGGVVECPLKHTDVTAEISGFIARVKVTQTFHNPLDEKIEAVYVFPLPHKAAVDDMTMVIGARKIVGIIKRRAAARAIYEAALAKGATAALLEQERPNIFTQSVGNIKPNQEVKIEISYVDVLEYDMGVYTFHFPMVVGPRYIPGGATSKIPPVPPELKGKVGELDKRKVREGEGEPKGAGWSPDTDRVPDASRITPPVLKPGVRNGHDVSLSVRLDAGVPVRDIRSPNHKVTMERTGPSGAHAAIVPADSIPNKDFVLEYAVVGAKPEMAVLAHTDPAGRGYFMLMIQPQEDERLRASPPREISFLIDVSGSMRGNPMAKVREAMQGLLKLTKPADTLQVITFAGGSQKLFDKAVPCTPDNVNKALKVTEGLRGGGGTEMLKGIKMAINDPIDPERVRIVIMLTDGYIGNEAEIIEEVGRRCGDQIRFWCIGIGQSPNRFLVDGVAKQGGGMAKVLGLNDDAGPLVTEVMHRIHRAQLAKISIDWGALRVFETYPARIPELWAGRPVIVFGMYEGGGSSGIAVNGRVEGDPVSWPLRVELPVSEPRHDVLAKVWARHKIEELMHQTYYAGSPQVEETVTSIALEYRLMSQYTSFVAVDESELGTMIEPARPPRRMLVPVPIPEGTRYEGFFGGESENGDLMLTEGLAPPMAAAAPTDGTWGRASYFSIAGKASSASAGTWFAPGIAGPAPAQARLMRHLGTAPALGLAKTKASGRYAARGRVPVGGQQAYGLYGGLAAGTVLERRAAALGDWGVEGDEVDADQGYTATSLSGYAQEAAKRAAEVLKAAQGLHKKGDLTAARAKFTLAYLLDNSALAYRGSNGRTAAAALEGILKAGETLLETWTKDVPGLKKHLDLVIRDASVAEALKTVARAVGLKVSLIPGSVDDAAALMGRKHLRVTYLDLRGATAIQAFDWILMPLRMAWWVEKDGVVAGTVCRGGTESAWVYDVSLTALPSAKDLATIKDRKQRVEAAKKAADAFLAAVRKHLGAGDEAAVWYGPGQLLVAGAPAVHVAAARLFADLADPDAKLEGDLVTLHETTSKRAADRKDAAAKMLEAGEKARVAGVLARFSWQLLAAAARGNLDMEALTELQVAWQSPCAAELLKGPAAAIALRSLWAVTEASRALPEEKELASLAMAARRLSESAAGEALKALEKSPDDQAAFYKVLYAALAMRDDADFHSRARAALAAGKAENAALAPFRVVAAALLAPAKEIDSEALAALLTQPLRGNDMVVLTALACRRAGGAAWDAFRAESRSLLGDQPLDGSVVVLVNSLASPRLTLATAQR